MLFGMLLAAILRCNFNALQEIVGNFSKRSPAAPRARHPLPPRGMPGRSPGGAPGIPQGIPQTFVHDLNDFLLEKNKIGLKRVAVGATGLLNNAPEAQFRGFDIFLKKSPNENSSQIWLAWRPKYSHGPGASF